MPLSIATSVKRFFSVTAFTLIMAAIFTVIPSSARAAEVKLGIGSNYQFANARPFLQPDLGRAAEQGVRYIREDIYWDYVQPAPDVWRWDRYDTLFRDAASQRVEILPILGYGTPWATGSTNLHALPPNEQARHAFASYAAAVVRRYGPGGDFWREHPELKARPITAVEVWNEPWYPGPADPASYAALVQNTASAVRALGSGIRIVANADERIRELSDGRRANWATAVLDSVADIDHSVDAWSIHPYARAERPTKMAPWEDSVAQVRDLRHQLADRGIGGEIWITELGFTNLPTVTEPLASEKTSKHNLTKAVTDLIAMDGRHNPVARIYTFTIARANPLANPAVDSAYGFYMVRADGSFTPALKAYFRVIENVTDQPTT